MCGIFGVIKSGFTTSRRASIAFEWLSIPARLRGKDASGFAAFTGRKYKHLASLLPQEVIELDQLRVDGWHIYKATTDFLRFWAEDRDKYQALVERAQIIMGHTRLATTGSRYELANASPLVVGNLIGTHNGGVAMREILDYYDLPYPSGDTSSEVLFMALNEAGQDPDSILEVLETIRGRAALVWVHRSNPEIVYLARAALSPLATAYDAVGNFYWASNYHWFKLLDKESGNYFGFREITTVPEGTLLVVKRGIEPVVEQKLKFQPFVRLKELEMSDDILWSGFTPRDIKREKANAIHYLREKSPVNSFRQPKPPEIEQLEFSWA